MYNTLEAHEASPCNQGSVKVNPFILKHTPAIGFPGDLSATAAILPGLMETRVRNKTDIFTKELLYPLLTTPFFLRL